MALTLATARERAQAMLDEPGVIHITATQWLTLANSALNDVFMAVADVNPDQFAVREIEAFAPNLDSNLLSDPYTYGDIYRVLGVDRYTSATPNYATDIPYRLTPIRLNDVTLYRSRNRSLTGLTAGDVAGPTHYAVSGDTDSLYIYLAPVPTDTVYLSVTIVPMPTFFTTDSDPIGLPPEYHDAFVTRLASRVNIRTGGRNQAIELAWRDAKEAIQKTAGPKIDDEPWNVRVVPEYY